MPDFSVRVDPLNWLLDGNLFLELEVEALEWLTIETVPMFVVSAQPPIFNAADELEQSSAGLGPLAGTSLGVGFWLDGDAFRGTVLRASWNYYAVDYETIAETDYETSVPRGTTLDEAMYTRNRLAFLLGSSRRYGAFTIGGGFGLEYELEDNRRCIIQAGGLYGASSNPDICDNDEFHIATGGPLDRNYSPDAYNLHGFLHPFYLSFRLSLGVTID